MPKILVVPTGSDHWTLTDGTEHPTGFWAEELLSPLQVFSDAGIEVDLASPQGRDARRGRGSLARTPSARRSRPGSARLSTPSRAGSSRRWSSPMSTSAPTTPSSCLAATARWRTSPSATTSVASW